ncbi:MAG: DUF86 domain-containing protein [Sedimentisphaerales bacterium]
MKDDRLYLIHIKECIERIESYIVNTGKPEFMKSTFMQDAVIRNLQVLSESSQRLSDEAKESREDIDWFKIAGFRNVLVHDYLGLDLDTVWNIVINELPILIKAINEMLG